MADVFKASTSGQTNQRALVTLAVGAKFRSRFDRLCTPSWTRYAQRHGLDVVVFDRPLDTSDRALRRSPAWQKCLVAEQPELAAYEQVTWIDADIIINAETAPCIFDYVPVDRVGGVNDLHYPDPQRHDAAVLAVWRHWHLQSGRTEFTDMPSDDFYTSWGLPEELDQILQTGVIVFNPRRHGPLFRKVYDNYEDKGDGRWNYEMRPLCYELIKAGLVEWIDTRFNAQWLYDMGLYYPFLLQRPGRISRMMKKIGLLPPVEQLRRKCLAASLQNAYFLHFCGATRDMALAVR